MKAEEIFKKLWIQYSGQNPSVKKIHQLFRDKGEEIVNDHVAFRTFNDPRVCIDVIARPFIEAGYVKKEDYKFEVKKLRASHYELPGQPESPRVFISELLLDEFSDELQKSHPESPGYCSCRGIQCTGPYFQGKHFWPHQL